ncbi:phage terminase large subunit family protein [Candidatus Pacearchaeota archaeon]|nr:phage terminase large subunit family protein [Candidatus Pacearchaeota archaeon]
MFMKRNSHSFESHLTILKTQLLKSHQIASPAEWVHKKTYLNSIPFSYEGHEYQRYILNLPRHIQDLTIRKPSQIGISELLVRLSLYYVFSDKGFSLIYTLPSYNFGQLFGKTRVDPVITESPFLREQIDRKHNSAGSKRFMNSSMFYIRGASAASQAISIPADMIIADERDFAQDDSIITSFTSRLTHSKYKLFYQFSTPTTFTGAVSKGVDDAQVVHMEFIICDKCNHEFHADYYKHVILPGFDLHLKEASNRTTLGLNLNDAYLKCPKCDRPIDYSSPESRIFRIIKGDVDNKGFNSHAVQLTPFAAPSFIKPGDLIKSSTRYSSRKDFVNFGLGLPFEDATTGLSEDEIRDAIVEQTEYTGPVIIGADMGSKCGIVMGKPTHGPEDVAVITNIFYPSLVNFEKTLYSTNSMILAAVLDSMPYTDLVYRLQQDSHNIWGAVFKSGSTVTGELYNLKEREADSDKALDALRRLSIDRNLMLDLVVNLIRSGDLKFAISGHGLEETFVEHLLDLKRAQILDNASHLQFVWKKSASGIDHFFFAVGYFILANKVKGLLQAGLNIGCPVRKFKTTSA